MKRREIKFVAGSLQLAPDRIETAPMPRKGVAAPRKGRKRAGAKTPMPTTARKQG
jgi:hypothetical protein